MQEGGGVQEGLLVDVSTPRASALNLSNAQVVDPPPSSDAEQVAADEEKTMPEVEESVDAVTRTAEDGEVETALDGEVSASTVPTSESSSNPQNDDTVEKTLKSDDDNVTSPPIPPNEDQGRSDSQPPTSSEQIQTDPSPSLQPSSSPTSTPSDAPRRSAASFGSKPYAGGSGRDHLERAQRRCDQPGCHCPYLC